MPDFPRFAPGTLPYFLDKYLWITYRLAAVIFLFAVLATLAVRANRTLAGIAGLSFVIWVGAWLVRWYVLNYWED